MAPQEATSFRLDGGPGEVILNHSDERRHWRARPWPRSACETFLGQACAGSTAVGMRCRAWPGGPREPVDYARVVRKPMGKTYFALQSDLAFDANDWLFFLQGCLS